MNNSTAIINNSVLTSFGQNFQGAMRRDWQPSWGGEARGHGRGGRGRGQGRIQNIQFYQPEGSKVHSVPDDGLSIQSILTDFKGNTLESEFDKDDTFSNILNSLKNCTETLFSFHKCDINKFYGEYFGVVNISNYQIHFEELEILGTRYKILSNSPTI